METTVVYWGYIGVMEKKMETSVVSGLYRDNLTLLWYMGVV